MNQNNDGSFFGGLLIGAGFTGLLYLPMILMRKLGITVLSVIHAIALTTLAAYQPALLALASDGLSNCTRMSCTINQSLYDVLNTFGGVGWYLIAAAAWLVVILMPVARKQVNSLPACEAGK